MSQVEVVLEELEAERREQSWQEVVESWHRSGLSQAEFCRHHGLVASTLSRWNSRLLRQSQSEAESSASAPPAGFLAVRVSPVRVWPEMPTQPLGHGFEVSLPGGQRVRLDPEFDAAGLRRLLLVLEGLPC